MGPVADPLDCVRVVDELATMNVWVGAEVSLLGFFFMGDNVSFVRGENIARARR